MAKCDLCGEQCSAQDMQQLLDSYRIPGVVDICPDCTSWANKYKSDLLLKIPDQMKEAIEQKYNESKIVKPSFFTRLLQRLKG